MTRKQVADRLGRSLATVRRLEGSVLHPRRDSRGVHHFERDEVEALARDLDAGRVSLPRDRGPVDNLENEQDGDVTCSTCALLQAEVDTLAGEVETLRRTHRREVEALRDEGERAQARLRAEMKELEREVADFVSTVESTLG